eukprot:scaffold16879_cov38-Phaeocystis_antarctica.AAC.1
MLAPFRQEHGVSARHNKFGTFQVKIEQKTERANIQHGKRSPRKKAAVTKFKGAHLLKWLSAYCVMNCVGAVAVSSSPPAPFPTPPSTCECSAELEKLEAKFEAKLEAVLEFVGMTPPSSPP